VDAPQPREADGGLVIVVNSDAGLARRMGPQALRALAGRVLGPAVRRFVTTDRHDMRAVLHEIALERPMAIGVIGGDGTSHAALETLTPLQIPTAPLPGGTMNRLSARVFGRATLEQSLRELSDGAARPLSGARAGGHAFYVAAGFGAWMQLQKLRERLRKRRASTALAAIWRMAPRQFSDRVRWSSEGAPELEHSTLVVGVGRIDTALGFGLERHDPIVLEAAGADIRDWGDVLALTGAAVLRRWRKTGRVTALSTRSLVIESLHAGVPALLDGEFHMLPQRNEIAFDPAMGLVWAPKRKRAPW
jgi:diacylglycerol kinase family enzyme